jgi:glycosyltransferase involved in cell wall biosynthesis
LTDPKVTFVTGSNAVWGAEISLLTIARDLGLPARLLASNPDLVASWIREVGPHAARVRARPGRISRNLAFISALARETRHADVFVIFDFYLMPATVIVKPLMAMRGVRLIVDVHDASDRNPRRAPYFRSFRVAHLAIAISDYIARQLPKRLPRVRIYRPVGRPSSITTARSDRAVIGIVGQVSADKLILQGLEAIGAAGVDAEIVVRGNAADGGYADEVRARGKSLFGDSFVWEGRVDRDHVMDGLDILFVPNSGEPFGRVAVEAQLCGTLAVGPRAGGIAEIIDDNVTGFTFDAMDRTSMRDALLRAMSELEKPTGVADRAMSKAEERFDPTKQAREYAQAIRHVSSR